MRLLSGISTSCAQRGCRIRTLGTLPSIASLGHLQGCPSRCTEGLPFACMWGLGTHITCRRESSFVESIPPDSTSALRRIPLSRAQDTVAMGFHPEVPCPLGAAHSCMQACSFSVPLSARAPRHLGQKTDSSHSNGKHQQKSREGRAPCCRAQPQARLPWLQEFAV